MTPYLLKLTIYISIVMWRHGRNKGQTIFISSTTHPWKNPPSVQGLAPKVWADSEDATRQSLGGVPVRPTAHHWGDTAGGGVPREAAYANHWCLLQTKGSPETTQFDVSMFLLVFHIFNHVFILFFYTTKTKKKWLFFLVFNEAPNTFYLWIYGVGI